MKKILRIITISLFLLNALLIAGCTVNNTSLKDTETPICTGETPSNTEVTADNTAKSTLPPSTVQTELSYRIKKMELPMKSDCFVRIFEMYLLEYKKNYTSPNISLNPISSYVGYKGSKEFPSEEDIVLPSSDSLPKGYSYVATEFRKESIDCYSYWMSNFSSNNEEEYTIWLSQYIHSFEVKLSYSENIITYLVETKKYKGIILERQVKEGSVTAYTLLFDDGEFTYCLQGKNLPMEALIKIANDMDLHPPREYYLEPEL